MKTRTILGLASTLVRGRKFKMMAVGLQLAYMGYRYFKDKKRKNQREAKTVG
ncbi:hypothetical protein [Costertonia aggregata]|uniref:Uncharacterized protein n=1 Tax=Costertonia aggregata TaxID=343403 RepID=A0A7H9AT77_9FLAO|nr:hypothetical protein [Costertonia aggregata]QLG46552.1 hypothetical protein HYG79_14750 [Costertonia aggregata]